VELTAHQKDLIAQIVSLKKEKNAILLAHNYQRPEIFEVADFIGDSLELCRKAATTDAERIVFCGVHFMAESAAVLNPSKKVLLPALDAGCALSDMITAEQLREKKKQFPDAAVVCYVNCTADVKAESDVCCTSSNAAAVVRALPQKQILFVPDKNLAHYVSKQVPEKEIIAWDGFCPIHHRITVDVLMRSKAIHPEAKLVVHPECQAPVLEIADCVASTSKMADYCRNSDAKEFIIITECGLINRLLKEMPDKKFYTVCNMCYDMKKNTLESIVDALEHDQYEIRIPADVMERAQRAFRRMFELTENSLQSSVSRS
jgi:quinolinate synthase